MNTPHDNTLKSLTECKKNETVRIIDIQAGSGAITNLKNMGIKVGDTVTIKSKSPIKGPLVIRSSHSDIAVGNGIAGKILVKPQ